MKGMEPPSWNILFLLREASLNVFGYGSKMRNLALLAVLLGSTQVVASGWLNQGLEDNLSRLTAAGRNVMIYSSSNPERPSTIGRQSCEALTLAQGVERSGLIQQVESIDIPQIGSTINRIEASFTLFPDLKSSDLLIGSALPESPEAGSLITADGAVLSAVRSRPQPSGIDTNSAVVQALPPNTDAGVSCAVVLDKFARTAQFDDILGAQLATSGGPVTARLALNERIDVIELFIVNPLRYLPLLFGLLGGITSVLVSTSRSSEYAVYRMAGTSRGLLGFLVGCEHALVAGVVGTTGALSALLVAPLLMSPPAAIMWALSSSLLWLLTSLFGTFSIILRDPLSLAKDR